MKEVVVQAIDLKVGDVVNGQRINHQPLVVGKKGKEKVHIFLIKRSGYSALPKVFKRYDTLTIKRPKYNLSKQDLKSPFDRALNAIMNTF